MTLRQIEYFIKVSEEKSFTKAAQVLHISQPSISKVIKSLEEELNTILFVRDKKNIKMTDIGLTLYNKVIKIIEEIDDLSKEISLVTQSIKGKIIIGIPPIIGVNFFPSLLGEFKHIYPDIELNLVEVGTKYIENDIILGKLDIGIICSYSEQITQLNQILLTRDPIMLVTSLDHPLAKCKKAYFYNLKGENFILFNKSFSLYDKILNCCKNYGFEPKIICESSQGDFILEMVLATNGIAFLPNRTCLKIDKTKFRVLEIEGENLHLELALVWKKDSYLSYSTKTFGQFVQDTFKRY